MSAPYRWRGGTAGVARLWQYCTAGPSLAGLAGPGKLRLARQPCAGADGALLGWLRLWQHGLAGFGRPCPGRLPGTGGKGVLPGWSGYGITGRLEPVGASLQGGLASAVRVHRWGGQATLALADQTQQAPSGAAAWHQRCGDAAGVARQQRHWPASPKQAPSSATAPRWL